MITTMLRFFTRGKNRSHPFPPSLASRPCVSRTVRPLTPRPAYVTLASLSYATTSRVQR